MSKKMDMLKSLFFDGDDGDDKEVKKYYVDEYFLEGATKDELSIALMQNAVDMERLKLADKMITEKMAELGVTKADTPQDPAENTYNPPGRGNANRPVVAFVGASPSKIDFIRQRPFSGLVGKTMSDLYIGGLGLTEGDVYMTNIVKEFCFDENRNPTDPADDKIESSLPEFVKEMEAVQPRFIVALGKTAKEAIGDICEEWVPHPRAINMNTDSGEVKRKMSRLSKKAAEPDAHMEGVILKSGDEKQIVYGVVMEPMENDTDENWSSVEQIEEAAHMFMKNFQAIDTEHSRVDIDATPVENWIAHEDTTIGGQPVKAGSWVMGVKIADPEQWAAVKAGEYGGFSIDAIARIDPTRLLG